MKGLFRVEYDSPRVREDIDAWPVEFRLLKQLLEARQRAGLTQEDGALGMGTTRSAISRLQGSNKHLPALSTRRRYADVLGCDVQIQPVPRSPQFVAAESSFNAAQQPWAPPPPAASGA